VREVVDPLGGSYYVEALTDELEKLAIGYIEKVDGMGGAVAAIEQGFYQDEIHEAAFRIQQAIEREERIVVGVNRYQAAGTDQPELQRIGDEEVAAQIARVRELRASRDGGAVESALAEVRSTAEGAGNLLAPMREALRARTTLGEVSDVLRDVFREYYPTY
jgi:methylmalonyl-CoA mutase N-terminal domain/subunit